MNNYVCKTEKVKTSYFTNSCWYRMAAWDHYYIAILKFCFFPFL